MITPITKCILTASTNGGKKERRGERRERERKKERKIEEKERGQQNNIESLASSDFVVASARGSKLTAGQPGLDLARKKEVSQSVSFECD